MLPKLQIATKIFKNDEKSKEYIYSDENVIEMDNTVSVLYKKADLIKSWF